MKGKLTKIFTGIMIAATVVALPALAIAANAQSQQTIFSQQPTSGVQQPNKGKEEVKRGKILSYGVDHVAKSGETLYSIAVKYYGDKSRWKDIYEATKTKSRIDGGPGRDFDPANLPVGMVIYVPYPTQGI
jgi:nucleoid-associated protein YgaU